jgi:hypothetical protein
MQVPALPADGIVGHRFAGNPCPDSARPVELEQDSQLSQRRISVTSLWHFSNIKSLELLDFLLALHCSITQLLPIATAACPQKPKARRSAGPLASGS